MPRPQSPLTIHKFGGAALADAAAIVHAARIVAARHAGATVVVASAMRGVTDALLELAVQAAAGDAGAVAEVRRLSEWHDAVAAGLGLGDAAAAQLRLAVEGEFRELAAIVGELNAGRGLTPETNDAVVARGERVAARMLAAALAAAGVRSEYVDAVRVIQTDGRHGNAAPDHAATRHLAQEVLEPLLRAGVVPVVPGFVGRTPSGGVATLGRGGSDLTATVLGRALEAGDVMLWKDVPGMLTADPRIVPDARLIPALHVREAGELAYYGAKVLHPRALMALGPRTRLVVRPFADPEAPGTEVSAQSGTGRRAGPERRAAPRPVKAITAIGDQALVTIAGNGMVGVPGIAARAFGAIEHAGLSVSFISQASSEHSICLGLPGSAAAPAEAALRAAFAEELARGEIDGIEVRPDVATMAIVGLGMAGTRGVAARLFGALADARVNVVAIAQGASELNISVVVDGKDAATAQRAVHAAFNLDKIGGGAAVRATHTDVVLLGFGQIGRELVGQLAGARAVRVVGVIDRSGYVFSARGLSRSRLAALAEAKRAGTPLAAAEGGVAGTPEEALAAIARHALSNPVLVDVTAGDTGPLLEAAAEGGMHLVLANKRPLTVGAFARGELGRTATGGPRLLHEATVGAGLPIIDTFHKLVESGDRVLRVEGCPSGTLGFLFGELGHGRPFSAALRSAMARGYTEPDPRDDLSGMDVARKALILGRLLGYKGELSDIAVESLVPDEMAALSRDEFLARLEELDPVWARRVAEAREQGTVLRYRATVTRQRIRVGVVAVDAANPLAALSGTDNQFAFTTARYRSNPLVITGPGAGAAVTAAGVLNDILKVAGGR